MIKLKSNIDGKQFTLLKLKDTLEPMGYTVGGNWDYDHGYLDYKIAETEGNQYLRVPFVAIDGEVEDPNCKVKLGTPFLLSHEYEDEIDEEGNVGNVSATFNQFKEPKDKDAEFPTEFEAKGKVLVAKLEAALVK